MVHSDRAFLPVVRLTLCIEPRVSFLSTCSLPCPVSPTAVTSLTLGPRWLPLPLSFNKAGSRNRGWGSYTRQNFIAPFWSTVHLQYVYKWLITQAMSNWVTTNVVCHIRLFVESILNFVGGETVNCSLSKWYFGNVL